MHCLLCIIMYDQMAEMKVVYVPVKWKSFLCMYSLFKHDVTVKNAARGPVLNTLIKYLLLENKQLHLMGGVGLFKNLLFCWLG